MDEVRKSKVSMQVLKSQSTVRSNVDFGPKSISRLRMRKASFGFTGVPGIKPVDRTSQIALEFRRPPLVYLNTYQIEPRTRFHIEKVTLAMEAIVDEAFTDHKYNEQESPAMALRLSAEIMHKVKDFEFNRYRIISIVTIAQRRAQCYTNAIGFLWDHERDAYVDLMRETNTAFLQATCFGVYFD